jgi:hypothetical protein
MDLSSFAIKMNLRGIFGDKRPYALCYAPSNPFLRALGISRCSEGKTDLHEIFWLKNQLEAERPRKMKTLINGKKNGFLLRGISLK